MMNQECVAVALGRIMQKWREPADIKTSQVKYLSIYEQFRNGAKIKKFGEHKDIARRYRMDGTSRYKN